MIMLINDFLIINFANFINIFNANITLNVNKSYEHSRFKCHSCRFTSLILNKLLINKKNKLFMSKIIK